MNRALLKRIGLLLAKRGAKRVSIFGSYARGEEKKDSDVDVIAEFGDQKSLLDLVEIEEEVSRKVGKKVDLLTKKSISPHMKARISREAKVVYS